MALLNRLFSSKRKPPPQQGYGSSLQSYHNSFEFSKDQVRILLFRECERRGRKLLFDSKAVKKIPVSSVPQSSRKPRKGRKAEDLKKSEAIVEITNGCCYQYTRPPSDIKLLGEMIFGSVAMTLRGSTFKVHVGGTPPVFMLTKVANSPLKRESEHGLEDSYGSSINSMNEFFTGGSSSSDSKLCTSSGSCPLDVPLPSSFTSETSQFLTQTNKSGYPGSLEGDSGCYTSSDISLAGAHPNSSFSTSLTSPDSRKGSGESLSSLRRRWLRTASTSLDLDSNLSLTYNDSPISCGSFPAWNDEKPVRRTKLGMAVVISLTHHQKESMQEFLLKHAALLEKMAVRLNAAVERAYCRKELFVSMMYDASCDVEQCVEDILLGPPLTMPVWLGLLTSPSEHSKIASCFLQELCQTLEEFDTKDSNFFLSSLVTTVLTHHLGWVPTVTPGLNQRSRSAYLEVPSSCWNLEDFPTVNPHNALWAQAMDLYGALGNPLKASRTIIVSASTSKSCIETVERLLRITSYFIRCAIISRQDSKLEDFNFPTKVAVGLSTSNENGVQVSVDDHKSSSCILHPVSGKGSPLRSLHQNSTEINVVGNLQSHIQRRSRGISPLADKVTSRSENSLIVQETSFDFPFKQPSGVGLRRNKSYTSRISSAAVCDSRASKERHTLSHAGGIQKCFSTLNNDFKMFIDSCGPSQNPSIETSPALEDKVVFVLGENEDLITLKGRSESKSNVFGCINKTSSDGREKFQKQPLSYSGSEVESGFSECDSFELSPVQSAYGNIVPSKDMSPDTSDASEVRPQSIGPRQSYLKNDENIASLTCARNFTLNEDIITVCNANSEVMVSKLSCVHSENGCNSALASSANLRSLARSVSVNLPVCYKSSKPELFTENLCLICATQIIDCDVKENMKPSKDLKIVCSRKSMKSLRRAHSTFSIKNQNVRSCKNVTLCQNCDLKLESSVTFSQNNQTRHFLKQQGGCVSAQPKDSKPNKLNFIELPLPVKKDEAEVSVSASEWGIAGSLIGGVSSHYIPERVLQGCVPLNFGWEVSLKRDLALEVQHPTLDPGLSEAVAIVANVDLCEVQLISSHTYVVERPGTLGIRAGLSQLVANMLESVHHMWKLHLSPDLCLSFLENRLQEILLRSQALSDLLLTVEFCDMDILTSTLSLEPNDIPLLMSVASTHSPEVTQRYGLSFR